MGSIYGLFGFLGWFIFILIPSWGIELYIRAFDYFITTFDHAWDSFWRLFLLTAALEATIIIARHYGFRYRRKWVSFLIGFSLGGLLQVLLAMFVFGFEF